MSDGLPGHLSPSSIRSKSRSRSRDTERSSGGASASAKGSGTGSESQSFQEVVAQGQQGTEGGEERQDEVTERMGDLPAFLRQTRQQQHAKFVDLEWQQRNRLAQATQGGSEGVGEWARVTSNPEVLARNRYLNVDPYENNRVKLQVPEGQSDYINASPIVLKSSKSGRERRWIATQGPKEPTTSHIWRMIHQETTSPAVIVMLTQTHESGREKCFQYFPASLSSPTLPINDSTPAEPSSTYTGTVTLQSLTEDSATRSTIRELDLSLTLPSGDTSTQKVWHLLFAGWPDFLIPEGPDRLALLSLVHLSRDKNASRDTNPLIVHCSAGVGRSGTFIALDHLLSELAEGALDDLPEEADPVVEVVDKLRRQRMMMVQGEPQFMFLYDVLREQWLERHHGKGSETAGVVREGIKRDGGINETGRGGEHGMGLGEGEGEGEVEGEEEGRQRKMARLAAEANAEMMANAER